MVQDGPVVAIGDVHLSRRAPSSCTDSYLEDLFVLLNQVAGLCRLRGAVALVIAGDLFHHKAPGRTDHGLVRALIELFLSVSCPVYITPGNHDLQNDRPESVDISQPLGVIFASGAARRLEGWMYDLDGEPLASVYGVPWLQEWSPETISGALETWRKTTMVQCKTSRPLVVTHAPIYPPGRELKWENTPASWWAEAMDGYGCLFYGHVHEPHGVFATGGVSFCNHGALSRGSLHEYNLAREIVATVWHPGTGLFEPVILDSRPAGEVFRLREHEEIVTSHAIQADFLARVGTATLPVMSVETVIENIRGREDIEPEVRELAISALEAEYGGRA
jgi:Icc-related predicted phosphoesterase